MGNFMCPDSPGVDTLTPPYSDPVEKAICKQSLHKGRAPEIILGNRLSGI